MNFRSSVYRTVALTQTSRKHSVSLPRIVMDCKSVSFLLIVPPIKDIPKEGTALNNNLSIMHDLQKRTT